MREGGGPGHGLMVGVLGPVEVGGADGVMAPVARQMQRVLLALLALAAGRVVTVPALVDALWEEEDGSREREKNLHSHVSVLRRCLEEAEPGYGASRLIRATDGYRLSLDPGSLDAQRFESLARRAADAVRDCDAATGADLFRQALGLWRGTALEDAAPWCARLAGEAARLEELRSRVVEDRLACDLSLGLHRDVAAELAQLTGQFPLRERLAGLRMVALWRCGRRGEALAVFDSTRRLIAGELGIDPGPELRELHAKVLADDPSLAPPKEVPAPQTVAPVPAAGVARGNLPVPLASFVGREEELAELDKLLGRYRLVTICGPGGAGKTRLAIELAASRASEYRDGVWFVDLAELADPAAVAGAAASALGIRQVSAETVEAALIERVTDMRCLLVFDNCEHLIDSVASTVERILEAGAEVRVIATSRQALSLPGEAVWETPPIAYPRGPQVRDPAELAAFDAVRLFIERLPHHDNVRAEDIRTITEITANLEGLPLAIELAAARAAQLDLRQLASMLADRVGLSTMRSRTRHRRQQTLDATIGWSYDLLTAQLRSALKQLSVFTGGFTLEAAAAVMGAPEGAAEIVMSLSERSLITVDRGSDAARAPARYRMLETIRQYCAARIAAEDGPGAEAALRDSHSRYFADLASRASRELRSWEQGHWRVALVADRANFVAAADHLLAQPDKAGDALAMIYHLDRFWLTYGYMSECMALLLRGLELGQQVAPAIRGRALKLAAEVTSWHDSGAAVPYYLESLRIARDAGDAATAALALGGLGWVCDNTADHEQGFAFSIESVELARSVDDPVILAECVMGLGSHGPDMAAKVAALTEVLALTQRSGDRTCAMRAHIGLGNLALIQGDFDRAYDHMTQAQTIQVELGRVEETVLGNLGWIRLYRQQPDAARAYFTEALLLTEAEHRRIHASFTILGLACSAAAQGDWERAATAFGFADRELQATAGAWAEPERTYREQWLSETERQLGPGFPACYGAGTDADRGDLIDFVLGVRRLPD